MNGGKAVMIATLMTMMMVARTVSATAYDDDDD